MTHPSVFLELLAAIYTIGGVVAIAAGHKWLSGFLVFLALIHYIKSFMLSRQECEPSINIYITKEMIDDAGSKDNESKDETGS
jgi:hypothetical protein